MPVPKTPIEEGFERIFGKMKNIDTPEDTELYQKITDICFENGGVTKPMVDKLLNLITLHTKKATYNAVNDVINHSFGDWNGADYAFDLLAQLTNPTEREA